MKYAGKTFTVEESLRAVSEVALHDALRRQAATPDEILLLWEAIPGILAVLRAARSAAGPALKFAVFTADECGRLIEGLDALFRETGIDVGALRATLVTAAYGKKPAEE